MTAVIAEQVRPRRGGQRSAYSNLVRTEVKLLVREVVPLLWGVGFPMALLAIMGVFSHGPDKSLGGFSLVGYYELTLIGFTMATFALQGLPTVLAGYRERGILRRLNATPVGAGRLLAAQLTVNLVIALIATAGILIVGYAAFGVPLPKQPAGFSSSRCCSPPPRCSPWASWWRPSPAPAGSQARWARCSSSR